MLEEGHITVNGRMAKSSHRPAKDEVIRVAWPLAKPSEVRPEEIVLDILHEDEWLLVLNKAPGMVVHPAAGHEEHTLVNALLHHCAGQLSGIGGVARPGIVHRLDKDTSGCLVVAKNDQAHLGLAAQFADRSSRKIYHAIVCGRLGRESGEIAASIGRHPSHRKRMAVVDGGREARTTYQLLENLWETALVQATLHTGRTHQIRVHFQHLGCPVLGDKEYGGRQSKRVAELTGCRAPRQMLHAALLEFTHPRTEKRVSFEAPWPQDFAAIVETLRAVPARR
jgi:23S rRNA pseudouridine1911/1915/1917 synthase